ncbi:MAG: sigma-54-dependent transcriptional regulator [Bradymonadia bacterium]
MTPRVLVVDDEAAVRFTLKTILSDLPATVLEARHGAEALEMLETEHVDLIISDLRMPKLDGFGLLEALKGKPSSPPFVMITAHGSERTAVEAMKRGAMDYFKKPFDADEVERVARRVLHTGSLARENQALKARMSLGQTMIFESQEMMHVAERVQRIAGRDVTVLIEGETGTGKECVARAILESSARREGPYICFNCAALPAELAEAELFGYVKGAFTGAAGSRKGLFRAAHGGTLVLDEVDSLAPRAQASVLRVLQEREVRPVGSEQAEPIDVRIIAMSGRPLDQVSTFRRDLYYRLNVVAIRLPPLRDRRADVRPLARHFARIYGERFGLGPITLSPRVLELLVGAPWPGNVRELQHTIERLVALAPSTYIDEDPFDGSGTTDEPLTLKARVEIYERSLITEALARANNNQSACARALGINRATLISKMERFGLK